MAQNTTIFQSFIIIIINKRTLYPPPPLYTVLILTTSLCSLLPSSTRYLIFTTCRLAGDLFYENVRLVCEKSIIFKELDTRQVHHMNEQTIGKRQTKKKSGTSNVKQQEENKDESFN